MQLPADLLIRVVDVTTAAVANAVTNRGGGILLEPPLDTRYRVWAFALQTGQTTGAGTAVSAQLRSNAGIGVEMFATIAMAGPNNKQEPIPGGFALPANRAISCEDRCTAVSTFLRYIVYYTIESI